MLVDNRVELWMFLVSWVLFTGRMVNKKRCEKLLQWETIFDAGAITCVVTPTDLLRLHHLLRCMGSSDAGHIEPYGMRRCLSFSYRGCAACRRPSPGGTKTAYFWRVLDVHKTSQIPSKMALGRGLFGARGGISKKLNTRRKLIFEWFFDNFWCCIFWCKNWGACKKHGKYRQKMTPRTRLELQKLPCFWLSIYLKI